MVKEENNLIVKRTFAMVVVIGLVSMLMLFVLMMMVSNTYHDQNKIYGAEKSLHELTQQLILNSSQVITVEKPVYVSEPFYITVPRIIDNKNDTENNLQDQSDVQSDVADVNHTDIDYTYSDCIEMNRQMQILGINQIYC